VSKFHKDSSILSICFSILLERTSRRARYRLVVRVPKTWSDQVFTKNISILLLSLKNIKKFWNPYTKTWREMWWEISMFFYDFSTKN